tara:strand:- start:911 stop:2029 length:1119 start_codon:yes stop_codon:yes gene_type:complete
MGVAIKYNPGSIIDVLKNIFFLIILISFFSCAPTTIEITKKKDDQKEKKVEITEEVIETDDKLEEEIDTVVVPTKPDDKIINFDEMKNILVILSDDTLLSSLFYDVFLEQIDNYENLLNIQFAYSLEDIVEPLDDTLIIGPISSDDLRNLPSKLGSNTYILALSNDYSLVEKFANNEIIFIPNSPYLHVEKLRKYIGNLSSIGVLYKQNEYGLKIFNHFKKTYPLIYIKSSSFGSSAIDLELSVNLLGNLDELETIIVIDDTYSYKDLIGYLATDESTYPLENIYLIDNFLEQRNNLENYYKPINRSNYNEFDLTNMIEPHREFFFKQSIELSLIIADKIFQNKTTPKIIEHEALGELIIENQMIDYPIIFD